MSKLQKPSQSKDETVRAQILDSAIKVFSTKGFDGARLREIADLAQVNHAMIKYYFGNKDMLWREAVVFLFERQTQELISATKAPSFSTPEEGFRALLNQLIQYSARYPEHARMVMMASLSPGPHLDWIIAQTKKHHDVQTERFLGLPADDTPNPTAVAMKYLVYGACHTIFSLGHEVQGIYGMDVTDPDFIALYSDLVLNQLSGAPARISLPQEDVLNLQISQAETADKLELRITIPKK